MSSNSIDSPRYHAITFAFVRVSLYSLGDSSKKLNIYPDTPPKRFNICSPENTPQIHKKHQTTHLPNPSFSGSIRNLPGVEKTTKPIGEIQPHRGRTVVGRYQGYMEQKSRCGAFLEISVGESQVVGLVLLEKNEWKLLTFLCNLFFCCFRFLSANGFCNY